MDFLAEFIGVLISVGICCSDCRKTRTENAGKISVETFRENMPFPVRFSMRFSVSNFLPRKSEKLAESVLQQRSLNNSWRKSTTSSQGWVDYELHFVN